MKWYTMAKAGDRQGAVVEEGTGRTVAVTYRPEDAVVVAAAPRLLDFIGSSPEFPDDFHPHNTDAVAAFQSAYTRWLRDVGRVVDGIRRDTAAVKGEDDHRRD